MRISLLKIVILLSTTIWSLNEIKAQNIGINGTGAVADASAILDVSSPTLGMLVPRVNLTAINATAPITSPTLSLLVFNTATASTGTNAVSPGYYYWDGTKWVRFAYTASGSSSTAWDLLGNAGTIPATNFLGTTDAQDLVFRTNNVEKMRLRANGTLNIGYTDNTLFDFGHQLNVKNHMSLKRWNQAPNYVQTRYNGTESSLTPVLSGDAVGAITFEASDGGTNRPTIANIFAYAAENVSSSTAGGHLTFRTTALTTTTTFERMRITANGNVGINKIIPSAKFHVYNAFAGPTSDTSIYSEYLPQSSFGITHYMASGISSLATATNVGYGLDFNAFNFSNEYGLYFSGETKNYFSGKVGIGTSTPGNIVEITQGTAGNSGLRFTNLPNAAVLKTDANGDVVPASATTATNNGVFWGLNGNSGTSAGTNFLGTSDNTDLVFKTNNNEVVRISNGAKVYVGGTLGIERFNVNGNGTFLNNGGLTDLFVGSANPLTSNTKAGSLLFPTGYGSYSSITSYLGAVSTESDLRFSIATGEAMRINQFGRVGIGTPSPISKLHVFEGQIAQTYTSNVSHSILMGNPSGRNWQLYHLSPSDANAPNGFMFEHFDGSVWQRRVTIDQTGNVGIGQSNPQSKLDVNGIILAGDNTATQGNIMMASQYAGLSDLTAVIGTEFSSGAPYIGYGVRTSTITQGSFINTHSITAVSRGALVLGGAGGGNSSIFRFFGNTNQSLAFGATPVMNEYMTMKDNGFLGIGTTTPTEKLEVAGSVKIVDGTQGAGKVLTSDAAGKATWQVSSGSLLSTQNIPAQSIPPVATTGLAGFSYVIPASNDYRIEYRNWCGFTGGTVGDNVALHIRLLKNGVPVDEFENYTVLGTSRVMTLNIILHAANCNAGDVLSLDLRPGIPAGATSIDFNVGNPWTTSKVLVFPE